MYWSISSLIALMSGVWLLTFVYFYLYMHYKERYILYWTFSWFCYALSYACAFWFAAHMKSNVLIIFVDYRYHLFLFNQIFILFSGVFLLLGTYEFVQKKMPWFWMYSAVLGLLWIVFAIFSFVTIRLTTLPTYLFIGIIYIWTGWVILASGKFEGVGKPITAVSFMLWGIYKIFLPVVSDESWLTPWGYLVSGQAPWGFLINMVMTFIAAIGIMLLFFNSLSFELMQSEERFRLMAENAQDIMYRIRLRPQFKIEYVSPACKSILGYTPAEFYRGPRMIFKVVYPDDRKKLKNLMRTDRVVVENIRWLNRRGQTVWMEHNNVPIFDKKGMQVAVEGIARNITERKKAESILQRYQLLSRWARDIILIMQPDGIIIEANKSAEDAYGYSREELLSLNVQELYVPESRQDIRANLSKAEHGIIFESVNRHKSGARFPVEVSLRGTIVDDNYCLLSITRDITLRKQEELVMLEARERVSRAERMASIGTMAAGIAHEINQPLNSLKVRADSMLFLYKEQKELPLSKVMQNIQLISEQAGRIDNIIKHMRCFVQRDTATVPNPCNLNDSIESALALVAAQISAHGIIVKKELTPSLPLIKAQSIHLEEIVINLVLNAVQALDKVKKSDKQVFCKTYLQDNNIVLEVSDNGPGIDLAIKDKIFDFLFSTTNRGENMGLGLSIIQSLVSSYNGRIECDNNEWGGATFKIRFASPA